MEIKTPIPNQELLDCLRSGAEEMRLELEDLSRREEVLRYQREGYMLAIKRAEDACLGVGVGEEKAEVAVDATNLEPDLDTHTKTNTDPDTDLSGLFVDFVGAPNIDERVRRLAVVAEKNDKLLNTTAATHYLLDVGQSTATVKNLRTSIHKAIAARPELYKKVSPGKHRYLGADAHPQVEQTDPLPAGEDSPEWLVRQEGEPAETE